MRSCGDGHELLHSKKQTEECIYSPVRLTLMSRIARSAAFITAVASVPLLGRLSFSERNNGPTALGEKRGTHRFFIKPQPRGPSPSSCFAYALIRCRAALLRRESLPGFSASRELTAATPPFPITRRVSEATGRDAKFPDSFFSHVPHGQIERAEDASACARFEHDSFRA